MSHQHRPDEDRLVLAVASAARTLTHAEAWADAIPSVLEELATSTGCDHASAFETTVDEEGRSWMQRREVWAAPSSAQLVKRWAEPHAYDDGFQRWAAILSGGGTVCGPVDGFPESERGRLEADGIASLIVVPVRTRERWWGTLVFTRNIDADWSRGEEAALIAVGELLGAAIDRGEQERKLHEAERLHRAHVEAIPAITYIENVDPNEAAGYGEVYVSPQIETMLGYTQEEWLAEGGAWQRAIHPEDFQRVWDEGVRTGETGEPFMEEYRVRTKAGEWRWIRDESRLVHDDAGKPVFWHGVLTDVTARKEAEAQVAFLAYHDPLTGLANRALLEELLEAALARARRSATAVALLFMDIDGFKEINDTLGHHAGDELLCAIAERLEPITRDTDLVARQGGDEFLVLMSDLAVNDGERFGAVATAKMMAERIHAALQEPFAIAGTEVAASMSIGTGIYPIDASDLRSLLKRADEAMYERKRARGRRVDLGREIAG
ncbi:MAG: diguanylate cyclase [Actinomycetota bacterium]